jgi:hypothetical protein
MTAALSFPFPFLFPIPQGPLHRSRVELLEQELRERQDIEQRIAWLHDHKERHDRMLARDRIEVGQHEAAHAVCNLVIGRSVHRIAVERGAVGYCGEFLARAPSPGSESPERWGNLCRGLAEDYSAGRGAMPGLEDSLVSWLAGLAWDLGHVGNETAFGRAGHDMQHARELAATLGDTRRRDQWLDHALLCAATINDVQREPILALGDAAAERGELDGDEIRAVLRRAGFPVTPGTTKDWPCVAAAVAWRGMNGIMHRMPASMVAR